MKRFLFSVLALAFALPAAAFEVPMPEGMRLSLYGQVRVNAWYSYKDNSFKGGDTVTETSDLHYDMVNTSRFGLRFNAGNFKANIETNFVGDNTGGGFGFRQFWGSYSFKNGLTVTAGQKFNVAFNGQNADIYSYDFSLCSYGTIRHLRRPMIMLSYAGFDFAVISNEYDHRSNLAEGAAGIHENYIPHFELAYNLKFNNFTGRAFASYALFSETTDGTNYINVNAWHVGIFAKPTFGRAYLIGGLFYGENLTMYGALLPWVGKPSIVSNGDGWDVKNVGTLGATLSVGMNNIVRNLSAELGGGYSITHYEAEGKGDLNTYAVYLNFSYGFNEYVSIVPQIGYYGRSYGSVGDGELENHNEVMAGMQFRVFF